MSGRHPFEAEVPISDLQESVLQLLEDAGLDTETNDEIMKLIEIAEHRLAVERRTQGSI
jgi:hypothetical protein